METEYLSDAFAAIHETMEALHDIGAIDKQTMREFDDACLTPVHVLAPEEIKAIRDREHISQTVFARYLLSRAPMAPFGSRLNGASEIAGGVGKVRDAAFAHGVHARPVVEPVPGLWMRSSAPLPAFACAITISYHRLMNTKHRKTLMASLPGPLQRPLCSLTSRRLSKPWVVLYPNAKGRVSGLNSVASCGVVTGHTQVKRPNAIRLRKSVNYWNVQECNHEHHDLQRLYRSRRVRRA